MMPYRENTHIDDSVGAAQRARRDRRLRIASRYAWASVLIYALLFTGIHLLQAMARAIDSPGMPGLSGWVWFALLVATGAVTAYTAWLWIDEDDAKNAP